MKCTECNDTRVYLGLGTAPPEPCRACSSPIQDVTGPTRASDASTPKLSFSSLSDGQYLVRDGSGIVECRVPKVNDNGSVKSDTFPKSDPITDAELQKLIDQAVKSGQNLDALIKGRTLAKDGVPPAITLHVTY